LPSRRGGKNRKETHPEAQEAWGTPVIGGEDLLNFLSTKRKKRGGGGGPLIRRRRLDHAAKKKEGGGLYNSVQKRDLFRGRGKEHESEVGGEKRRAHHQFPGKKEGNTSLPKYTEKKECVTKSEKKGQGGFAERAHDPEEKKKKKKKKKQKQKKRE